MAAAPNPRKIREEVKLNLCTLDYTSDGWILVHGVWPSHPAQHTTIALPIREVQRCAVNHSDQTFNITIDGRVYFLSYADLENGENYVLCCLNAITNPSY